MTQKSSTSRHLLYVTIAIVAAAQNGAGVTFGWNWETASYALAVISAGLVASRAYIDQSQSDVSEPPPEPEPEKQPYQQPLS